MRNGSFKQHERGNAAALNRKLEAGDRAGAGAGRIRPMYGATEQPFEPSLHGLLRNAAGENQLLLLRSG